MKKIVGCIVFSLFIFLQIYLFQNEKKTNIINEPIIVSNYGDSSNTVDPTKWVATDGLGRTIETNRNGTANRQVGIFYWTWHASTERTAAVNTNTIHEQNPSKKNDYNWWHDYTTKNYGSNKGYWWNEPIYGYYKEYDSNKNPDKYVLRKQAELLADAGVDFVVFDCTNGGATYENSYESLLAVWKEAKNDGVKVPQIVFMLGFGSFNADQFNKLYNNLYNYSSSNYKKYNDMFYHLDGKKLILVNTAGAPKDAMNKLNNEFTVRKVESTYFRSGAQSNGVWGWLSTYPQAYYKKANGQPEQITVGIAQNANYSTNKLTAMNGSNVMGRSYASGNYSYSYTYRNSKITVGSSISGSTAKSTNTSLYGRNFQQQWEYARNTVNPEIIFVTGWNEWNMAHAEDWQGVKNAFVDEFNDEYSRDIEPTKGKLKDYYYYQLVDNIRKFKGVSAQSAQKTPVTITKTSDWNNSNIISYNHYTGGYTRNIKSNNITYTNNTFRNDIKKAKVSYDSNNIYFYVETVSNLSAYNSDKWMRLLIDTKSSVTSSDTDNWEEFEYILNRTAGSTSTLVLEKSKGGWSFTKVGDVGYRVNGNILEVTIPRSYLNLTSKNISFNFKWCDNNLDNGDIMTIYTDGDAAPGGRFAFHFEGTAEYSGTGSIVEAPTSVPIAVKGDTDGDGHVRTNDYILVRKHILKQSTLNSAQISRADMNGDGKITSADFVAIRKKLIK